jgi:GGDEF domain-containing protein
MPSFEGFGKPTGRIDLQYATREELLHYATHDPLTGLLNRLGFEIEMEKLVQSMAGQFSLLVMDIDGLKPLNDKFGHDAGDAHLKNAAAVIQGQVRANPHTEPIEKRAHPELTDIVTAARIGGDEFAIMIEGVGDQEMLNKIQARMQYNLVQENIKATIDGRPHLPGETAEDLIVSADHKALDHKNKKREAIFDALPWYKKRLAKLGDRAIRFAGVRPPRI